MKDYCKDEINQQTILTADQCFNRAVTSQLVDLQDGLKVYGKNIRSLFCISTANSLDKLASFVDTQFKEINPERLNRTIMQRADINHFAPIDKTVQPPINGNDKVGYQVGEPIKAQIG